MWSSFDEIRVELGTNFEEVIEAQGKDWQTSLCEHVSALRNRWESLPRGAKPAAPLMKDSVWLHPNTRAAHCRGSSYCRNDSTKTDTSQTPHSGTGTSCQKWPYMHHLHALTFTVPAIYAWMTVTLLLSGAFTPILPQFTSLVSYYPFDVPNFSVQFLFCMLFEFFV